MIRLAVTEAEREPLRLALHRALRRGQVEYDPTRLVLMLAGLKVDPTHPLPMPPSSQHALLDVLRWTNSERERKRWTKPSLDVLKALRLRVERGEDAPEPAPVPVAEGLW